MATYRVMAPCSYVSDGAAHVHSRAGAVVELDDATAAELGDAVRKFVDPIVVEIGDGKAEEAPLDDKSKAKPKRRSGIDGATGTPLPTGADDDDLPILQSDTGEAPADGQ